MNKKLATLRNIYSDVTAGNPPLPSLEQSVYQQEYELERCELT